MDYKYQSVLYPRVLDGRNEGVYGPPMSSYPTEELVNQYARLKQRLDEKLSNEPAMKRRNKTKYQSWIQLTHDLRDELNTIASELRSRGRSS